MIRRLQQRIHGAPGGRMGHSDAHRDTQLARSRLNAAFCDLCAKPFEKLPAVDSCFQRRDHQKFLSPQSSHKIVFPEAVDQDL